MTMTEIAQARVFLKVFGTHLWGNKKAREDRKLAIADLTELPYAGTLLLDCAGVEALDHSYGNAFFVGVANLAAADFPGTFVVVTGLSEDVRRSLARILRYEKTLMVELGLPGIGLIGDAREQDKWTFVAVLQSADGVTAQDIADLHQLTPTAANERLARLRQFGVIRRVQETAPSGRLRWRYFGPVLS